MIVGLHYISFTDSYQDSNFKGSVINMSSVGIDLPVLRKVIREAIEAGILVVTPAGNEGKDRGSTPCGYLNVICVGGVTKQYEKTVTSNCGTGVTIFAPAQELRGPPHYGDLRWIVDSGTSFAAPAVAGIVSVFVGFESIRDDAMKVLRRPEQNWHAGVLIDSPDNPAKLNILPHTAMYHPDSGPRFPYSGSDPNAAVAGLESEIDGASRS